jgi:hypothetical protein
MESVEAIVMQLERELLDPAVRSNGHRLAFLLADDFLEVGASGLSFGKPEVLARLPGESGIAFQASSMQAHLLAPGVVLVTYAAQRTHGGRTTHSLRSSVWVKNTSGWQMRYHQGTAAA